MRDIGMVREFSSLCHFGIFACFVAITVGHEALIHAKVARSKIFPYQVAIHHPNFGPKCGGAIITRNNILTAAHCVHTKEGHIDRNPLSIFAGSSDLVSNSKTAVTIPVKKLYVPKEYKHTVHTTGDIAVLMLKHNLEWNSHVRPVNLPDNADESYVGKNALISGWGWTWHKKEGNEEVGGMNDTYLRYAVAHVHAIPCTPRGGHSVWDKQLCAQILQVDHARPGGVCDGDSGGPLVTHDNTVIGILSIGPFGCSEEQVGAIYTRVTYYRTFIDNAIADLLTNDMIAAEIHN